MNQKIALTILFVSIAVVPLKAQLGRLKQQLQEKGQTLLKEKLSEETTKKQQEYDTTTFNYAIAFLDKSESFENKQKGEGMMKAAGFISRNPDQMSEKDKARDFFELGRINYNRRMYKLAEQNLTAALLAYEYLGETEDPVYLKTLGLLGLLYSDMGRFEKATLFSDLSLEGWQRAIGSSSQGFAAELNNSGVLYMNKGLYNEAETTLKKASTLIKNSAGTASIPYAISLNNLGVLYQYMGRNDEALKNITTAVEIAQQDLKEKSGTFIQLLTNKALIQQENKLLAEAEQTYLEAKNLQERRLKINRKSDPDYAHLLNNLASLYLIKGNVAEAENLLVYSLDIYLDKFGDNHPVTAGARADLGNLYRFQGKYAEAQPLIESALATRNEMLGEGHSKTVQSTEDLAIVLWKTGNIKEAIRLFDDIMAKSISFINTFFPPMSEAEKTKYWEKLRPRFYTFYNFAFEQYDQNPDLLKKVLEYRMATKGLLLSSTTKVKNSILNSGDVQLVALYQRWQDQKLLLAAYYNMTKEERADQSVNVDSLQTAANATEKQLSSKSSAFSAGFVTPNLAYSDLSKALKPNEVVVEMIQYPAFTNSLTAETQYAALVIAQEDENPELVQFPNGATMDTQLFSQYKNLTRLKVENDRSYNVYWKPLERAISPTVTIYFSPDGVYNQLNINTLLSSNNKYLIDLHSIRNVGNPSDILTEKRKSGATKNAFLVGFPEYGTPEIAPLPGTLTEVKAISQLLNENGYQIDIKTEKEANEVRIKEVASPSVLHIATHGYFMEDVGTTGHIFGVQVEYAKNNPLLRSGLMLAGASRSLDAAGATSYDQQDNGILTAYEAINLSLGSTDLVVLSACETGKGDIKSGEGVYGLQRAFKVAGANRTVMSLWKVDDEATQQLMRNFYTYWIKEKQSPEIAFRRAQIDLKSQFPLPYYWGAFVMME